MVVWDCAIYGQKKSYFIKNQEFSGLLRKLVVRPPLSNVPLISNILLKIKNSGFVLITYKLLV